MRFTYSGTTATLALVVALSSGGAYAANTLVAKNSVGSDQLRAGAVRSADLGDNSVSTSKVAPNALTGSDIDEGKLGVVPRAARAEVAGRASTAHWSTSSGSADQAFSAAEADTAASLSNVLIAAVHSFKPTPQSNTVTELLRSIHVEAVRAIAAGTVIVTFDRPVDACTQLVTLDGHQHGDSLGSASVRQNGAKRSEVVVSTLAVNNQLAPRSFNLFAYC